MGEKDQVNEAAAAQKAAAEAALVARAKDGLFTKADDGDFLGQGDRPLDKHLLIRVPDFGTSAFEQKGGGTRTEKLTSFLRLGKFGWEDETDRSKELLDVIHQAGGPGDPSLFDNTLSFTPGADWRTSAPPLQSRTKEQAELAGNRDVFFLDDVRRHDVDLKSNATLLAEFKAAQDAVEKAQQDVDAADAAHQAASDPYTKAATKSVLDGLKAVLRTAETALNVSHVRGHGLTREQRQNESRQLFDRGGWRDHSDGNRISTTYGDKVEVVRGNYKMIVMGRQDDPGEAMGWEATGDHVVDYAPGTMPGAGYWLEFVPDYTFTDSTGAKQTGVWLLVNTTENVYEYARYAGNFREERWGDVLETYVGSENPPAGHVGTDGVKGSAGHVPPLMLADRTYSFPLYDAKDEEARAKAAYDCAYKAWEDGGKDGDAPKEADFKASGARNLVPAWPFDNQDVIRSNPHIIEKTWARRIDSHRGSESCAVEDISEVTWATTLGSSTYAKTITDSTGSSAHRVESISGEVWAERLEETTDVLGAIFANTRAASLMEAKTATVIWETKTAANVGEIISGTHLSVDVGVALEVFLGAKFGFELSKGVELKLMGATEVTIPDHEELRLKKIETSLMNVGVVLQEKLTILERRVMGLSENSMWLDKNIIALIVRVGI